MWRQLRWVFSGRIPWISFNFGLDCARITQKPNVDIQFMKDLVLVHLHFLCVRRARDSRTELRRFMREMKMHDPEAVCRLEYDQLQINGRSYVWSDGVQAVVRTEDNVVGTVGRTGVGQTQNILQPLLF